MIGDHTDGLFPLFPSAQGTAALVLRSLGWIRKDAEPGRYSAWNTPTSPDIEILTPDSPEAPDFEYMNQRALHILRGIYGHESIERSLTSVASPLGFLDTTRWQRETVVQPGLIPWREGEDLHASARDQLIAAAKSCHEPRVYHGQSSSYVAKSFLDQCLLGQSGIGSYVVTAHTPRRGIAFISKQREESGAGQMGRSGYSGAEIMATFDLAVSTVRAALDGYHRTPQIEIFQEGVTQGISYELTLALSRFIAGSDCNVEMQRVSTDGHTVTTSEVSFIALESPVLQRAATIMVQDRQATRETITGIVTFLNREVGHIDQIVRVFTVGGLSNRRIRLRLSDDQYSRAIQAHEEDLLVQATGVVEKQGNLFWMTSPESFIVISSNAPGEEETLFENSTGEI